jgi:hypothetical protein
MIAVTSVGGSPGKVFESPIDSAKLTWFRASAGQTGVDPINDGLH